jgi:hypothetical protein
MKGAVLLCSLQLKGDYSDLLTCLQGDVSKTSYITSIQVFFSKGRYLVWHISGLPTLATPCRFNHDGYNIELSPPGPNDEDMGTNYDASR